MNNEIFNLPQSIFRNVLCALVVGVALPAFAQDELTDEAPAKPVKHKVVKEKYDLVALKGVVYDEATKQPVGGVQLKALENPRYTAMTEDDGSFVIRVPKFVSSLYVYSPGYLSQQVGVKNDPEAKAQIYLLSDKFRPMYSDGTDITASRSYTSGKSSNLTIDTEIQSQLGGDIRSIQRSGALAAGNSSFIRGLNSLNANSQPLIIVDGVEVDQQLDRSSLHSGQSNNMLAGLMEADIEKVTVLKNATALYGARGANGVILIETKRGKSMATRIDADISVGLTLKPRSYNMMNASQYRAYATELMGTMSALQGQEMPTLNFLNDDPNGYYYYMYHNDTDWSKEVYRTALTQNYSINVQGGDAAGMYNLSVGYVDGKSTAKGNDFDRMNVRFNTDISILRNLDTKFNLSISRTTSSVFDDGTPYDFASSTPTSPTFLALVKSPLLAPYQYNKYLGGFSSTLSEADEMFSELGNYSLANPTAILEQGEGVNKNHAEHTNFQVYIEPRLKLGNDWVISQTFSYTLNRDAQRYFRPITGVPVFEIANIGNVYNKVGSQFANENNVLSNTKVTFSHIFGAHTVKAFAGFRYNTFSFRSDYVSTEYTSAQNDKNPVISGSSSEYNYTTGLNDRWKQMQWYGNVDYNYKNRYFATVSLLGEANSRFGADCDGLSMFGVQWALFPSVQVGWVATNESWFPKTAVIDYLRFNVGYDISGNDGVNNDAARTIYTMVKSNSRLNGLQLTNIGNDKLKWESTRKFNAGFEANFLHNRLAVSFDYFHHTTKDLLTLATFSDPIAGLNKYWRNGGELQNDGFEVAFSAKPVASKNWNVELGASVGHYKNKVTSLVDGNYTSSVYGSENIITSVGNPVALFYGYKTDGVFSTDAEASTAGKLGYLKQVDNTGAENNFEAGDIHFIDLNGDGYIDENDKTVIGDPNPDIYGNIFANISWKNLTLSANFNYSLGNDVYNYQRSILNAGSNFYNQQVSTVNRWRYEGQQTDMPRATFGDPMGNNRFSDRWIEDGSYLRLKSLRLTYRVPVPSSWSWLQGLSVWGEAVNLFTLTKYTGIDPEFSIGNGVMYQGIDCGNLAQSRAFTLGVKINL